MTAGTYNITNAEQGSVFERHFVYKIDGVVVDITGYTARMHVRPSYSSSTVHLTLTTENGGITLGGASGTIDLLRTAPTMAAAPAGDFKYDLELLPAAAEDDAFKLLKGTFVVLPEVTR